MMVDQNTEALAWSLEEQVNIKGELDQLHNVAQVVISKVLRLGPSTSAPAIWLVEISDVVRTLISNGVFNEASGVLTLVVTHYSVLDFKAICGGYADGWSVERI